jgi:hypothetical protein
VITRKAYRYVEAEYTRLEAAGKTPTVTVHLDSGYSFNIRSLASYVSETDDRNHPEWLVFVREDEGLEYVPLERVARVSVDPNVKGKVGFKVDDLPAAAALD